MESVLTRTPFHRLGVEFSKPLGAEAAMDGSTVLVDGFAVGVGMNGRVQALSTSKEARATHSAANRRGADFMDSPIAG